LEKHHASDMKMANVISDKDLNELRDGQNREKIEQRQRKSSPNPVEVSRIMVDPAEVQDKSTITPQMTADQRAEKTPTTVNVNEKKAVK